MKKLFLIVVVSMVMSSSVSAKLVNQSGIKNVPYKMYEVKSGDTLSEIAWVLGVKMKDIVAWNPEILNPGIRRMSPGIKIKYRLPGDIEKVVSGTINNVEKNINKTVAGASGDIIAQIKKGSNEIPDKIVGKLFPSFKKIDNDIEKISSSISVIDDKMDTMETVHSSIEALKKEIKKSNKSIISQIVNLLRNGCNNILKLILILGSVFLFLFLISMMFVVKFFSKKEDKKNDIKMICLEDDKNKKS